MPTNITDDPSSFDDPLVAPSAGDAGVAASIQSLAQQIGNRTAFLRRTDPLTAIRNWSVGPTVSVGPFVAGNMSGMAGSGEWWVAVASANGTRAGIFASTHAGSGWDEDTTNPKNFDLNDVAWDTVNTAFIAVGVADGSDAYIVTAGDPTGTWTERANPKNISLSHAHVTASGAAIATGQHDGADVYTVRSTNGGSTWSEIAVVGAASTTTAGIASNGTTVVIVGQVSGGALIWSSTDDGLTFTARSVPGSFTNVPGGVTYDGSKFVMAGTNGQVATSTDGTTWAFLAGFTPAAATVAKVTADVTSGTIVAYSNQDTVFHVSTDTGATWSTVNKRPAHSQGGSPFWDVFAFDGYAWAMAELDSASDVVQGAQSLVMG